MLKNRGLTGPRRLHAALTVARLGLVLALALAATLAGWLNSRASDGYALQFDGQDDYVSLGATPDLFGGGGWPSSKTVSLWLRVDANPAPVAAPASGEVLVTADRPRLFGVTRAVANGRDALWVWNADANGMDTIPVDYTPGEWLHLALIHDGVTLSAYKNGLLAGSKPSGPTAVQGSNAGLLYLGGSGRAGAALYFAGQLDEVRFWQAALDAATIQAWMHRELDGAHPFIAQLGAYYRMSNGLGLILADDSGRGHPGALLGGMGDANWVASTAPLDLGPAATPSDTAAPTDTATPTDTPPPSDTPIATFTFTPSATPTETPLPSDTPTSTLTFTPSATPTASPTPTATLSPSPTLSPTATEKPTASPSPTLTPSIELPVEVGWIDTPGDANDVVVVGSLAYLADTTGGLRIYDLSNPAQPVQVGWHRTPRQAYGVAVQGQYAYLACMDAGLRIFDVSNPAAPVEVGFNDLPTTAWDVTVRGDYAYVPSRWDGLYIFDVSDPAHPALVSRFPTPDQALDVALQGPYAYLVAYHLGGLRVLDISNPAAPLEIASVPSQHRMYGVEVSGEYAYLADGGAGLGVVNIANPAAPVVTGYVGTLGFARSLTIPGGDLVYLADWNGGFKVVDVRDPGHPLITGSLATPGRTRDVGAYLKYAVLADYEGGLRIVQVLP